MNLTWSLILWLIVVIIVYLIAKNYHIQTFSAIVLALLIGAIVLGIIKPITTVDMLLNMAGLNSIYYLIMAGTSLILLIYVVWKAVTDISTPEITVTQGLLDISE